MALTPINASDSLIAKLSEDEASTKTKAVLAEHFERALDIINPTVPELFFHTKKRHLPDIYECRKCGYQFPQEATCPNCNSAEMRLFMNAPGGLLARHVADREAWLIEQDPDWRERFGGDVDLASDFYSGEPAPVPRTRLVGLGHSEQPPEVVTVRDDDVDFDDGLDNRDPSDPTERQ